MVQLATMRDRARSLSVGRPTKGTPWIGKKQALDYFTRLYEIGKTVLKETDAETGYAYVNLGLANHLLGNLDKALDY